MVTSDSLLIPLIPVIGNHEVVNGYKKDWYKPNKPSDSAKQAPYFYSLFIAPDSSSYRVLDFGNYMSLILLDSGHTTFVDEQEQWLADTLEARLEVPYKFAAYHVPAYPVGPATLATRFPRAFASGGYRCSSSSSWMWPLNTTTIHTSVLII